jgi:hypothetical protein
MRWEDERYVRLYTRDTLTWIRWGWEGQCVFALLERKVDRAGVIEIGEEDPAEALNAITGIPVEICAIAWARLSAGKNPTVTIRDEMSRAFVIPNFIEAQEANQSDAARKRKSRELARAVNQSRDVTNGHENGQKVTRGHTRSQPVTPSCAVPSLALEKDTSSSKTPSPVDLVFEHWKAVMGARKARLDVKREAAVKKQLAEGRSVEELCLAIDGYAKDPFHMGQNPQGTKYNDLTLICRDAEHVEKFLPAAALNGHTPPKPKRTPEERMALIESKFGTA